MKPTPFLIAVLALTSMPSQAALCDDTYNLQSASQTLLAGTDPKQLTGTSKALKPDLSDMDFIHDQMAYSFLAGFEGSCTKAAKPVRFLERTGQAAALAPRTETGYHVVMYDSTTTLQGSGFHYWFAFYKPADTLKLALGRTRDGAGDFRGWYGFVTFEDSVRDPESGLWASQGTRLRMAGPADSAALDSALMIRSGFRNLIFGENRRGHFKLQFIRVSLENKPAPLRTKASAPGRTARGPGRYLGQFLLDGRRIEAGKAEGTWRSRFPRRPPNR